MAWPGIARLVHRVPWLGRHLGEPQHRNTYALMASQALGAATGVLFWLLFARMVPTEAIGVGGAIVLLGTAVAVFAKGGFDAAIVRSVPGAASRDARRLVLQAGLMAAAVAVFTTLAVAIGAHFTGLFSAFDGWAWSLAAGVAVFLVVTWLQDAYFLAEGDAAFVLRRNVWLAAGRLVLPLVVIAMALVHPVALTWTLAVAVSAVAAAWSFRRIPLRDGPQVDRRLFLRRSARNVMGSAAEFLPGLLLVPLILALSGATAAGHFVIAWNAASLLFIASAAVGRSALSELVRSTAGHGAVIRRGLFQQAALLLPAAFVGIVFAREIMGIFGADYQVSSTMPFMLLLASVVFIAPSYLYLAVLRAEDRTRPLLVFPIGMLVLVFVLVPILEARHGLPGVAAGWLLANLPFGLYAAWRLQRHYRGVPLDARMPSTQ